MHHKCVFAQSQVLASRASLTGRRYRLTVTFDWSRSSVLRGSTLANRTQVRPACDLGTLYSQREVEHLF